MASRRQPTVLLISQVCEPDPAAVGQYVADAARHLAARGRRVVVLTSARGYEDPSARYPRRERDRGVEYRRLPLSSFGKGSLGRRIAAQLSFLAQATLRGLFVRGLEGVVISTSPPMAPAAALALGAVRRVPVTYWVMDVNPDQAVALGELPPSSPLVRAMEWLNRRAVRAARAVVVLDRFMADRMIAKGTAFEKVEVIPPWPLADRVAPVEHAANPLRAEWGLDGRTVVMHSGNHSPSHPLDTLLAAAARLADHPGLAFVFVGGGLAKPAADTAARKLPNVQSRPYQPIDRLRYSLAAADVHVVPMGDDLVGCVHPSKAYNALAAGRPILLIGPDPCHVSDLVRDHGVGWHVAHGDVDGLVEVLEKVASMSEAELAALGGRARRVAEEQFSAPALVERFCRAVLGPG